MKLLHLTGFTLASIIAAVAVQRVYSDPPTAPAGTSPTPTAPASLSTDMTTTANNEPSKTSAARLSKAGFDITPLSKQRIETLALKLSKSDRDVLLAKGTEPAFCGNLLDNKKEGTYTCKLCDLPLFGSDSKFNSGTGWPSFFKPYDAEHVVVHSDKSHGMSRDEIVCGRCSGHLGHVFNDGPAPTGQRYCLNSASLNFFDKGAQLPDAGRVPVATQSAYFAGGCFWGVEDRFQQLPGVITAISGYMGGRTANPTYKDICYSNTGHAETVRIDFDPSKITYAQLLEKFFKFHDPSQLNRQGPDVGDQYRSAIFTTDETQAKAAEAFIESSQKSDRFKTRKIVTQVQTVAQAGKFYAAEDYHQDYHVKNGGHCAMPQE